MISSPLLCRDLIGRREELNFLVQQFWAAQEGGCITIPIAGQAGMGKTRLVQELRAAISGDAATMVVGNCLEFVQSPYLPFRSIFAELFGGAPRLRRDRSADSADERRRYFGAIASQFSAAARMRRLAVVVEDIHWADAATLDLIEFLSHAKIGGPLLLLVTCRTDGIERNQRAMTLLGNLRLGTGRIELTGLSKSSTAQMILQAISGRAQVPDRVVDEIASISEGNPLFAEELLRSVVDHGAESVVVKRDMPLTMRAMLEDRLSKLEPHERAALVHAAVLGRGFDLDLLCRTTGRTASEIAQTMQKASDLQLIVLGTGLRPVYEFRHALIRAALETELIPEVARTLHESIANELQSKSDHADFAAELAYHWAASGNSVRAAECYERAGDAACAMFAYSDAAAAYHKVLEHEYTWGPHRQHVYEKLAIALSMVGSGESPLQWWRAACDFYEDVNATDRLASSLLEYARQCSLACDNENVEEAVSRVHALLAAAPQHPLHWHADVVLARHYARLVQPERALQTLAEAEDRRTPMSEAMSAMLHEARAAAYTELGLEEEFIAEGIASVEFANASNMPELVVQSNQLLGINMAYYGRTREAVNLFHNAVATATEHGYLWRAALARLTHAHTLLMLGEIVEARRLVAEALDAKVEMPKVRLLACSLGIQLGLLTEDAKMIAMADDERMIEVAFASQEPDGIAGIIGAYCQLFADRAQVDKARALLKRAAPFMKTAYGAWPMLLQVANIGDEKDIASARILFKRFLDYSAHHVIGIYYELFEALVARRNGDLEKAVRLGSRSAVKLRALGQRYLEGLAREAAQDFREALQVFRAVGASRDARRLERLTETHKADVDAALTHRQREIAGLVCAGKTNREIALTLYITEKTVEHHLAAIFSRLGITSRHQLISRILSSEDFPVAR